MIGNVPIAKFAPNAMIIPTRTKCFSATFAIEAIISIALVSKKFQAVDGIVTNAQIAHCAEKQILWAVWNLLMNLLLRCVARKLTGFLSSNLAALEEKSTLIQCVFLVTGKEFQSLRPKNFDIILIFQRLWKKGQFCPECNICFGRELAGTRGKDLFDKKTSEVEYSFCWVCSRQHHAKCVGDVPRFICQACQRRTQEKCVGLAGNVTTVSTELAASHSATPTSFATPMTSFTSLRPRRLGVNQ